MSIGAGVKILFHRPGLRCRVRGQAAQNLTRRLAEDKA